MSSTIGTPFWDPAATVDTELRYSGSGPTPEATSRDQWSAWDKMTIAGRDVPGHVVVFGRNTRRVDDPAVAGLDGARLTHLGYDPSEVDITVTLWTPGQWEDWQTDILPLIKPKPTIRALNSTIAGANITAGRNSQLSPNQVPNATTIPLTTVVDNLPSPVDVDHPALAAMGIRSLYFRDIGIPVPGPVVGTKVITLRATEFAPASGMNVLKTQTGSLQEGLDANPTTTPQASQPTTQPNLDANVVGAN